MRRKVIMSEKIYKAPPGTGTAVLGKSLPSLLYEACERGDVLSAFNQPRDETWEAFSLFGFRDRSEALAAGLLHLGFKPGERVGLFMESDVFFCLADMGCLMAGLVDVPIYLTHGEDAITYVLDHSGARGLFVSNEALLREVLPVLERLDTLEFIILAEGNSTLSVPERMELHTMESLEDLGREHGADKMRDQARAVEPGALATIIYTSGTTGTPKGVMLTHENISYNAMTAFSGMPDFVRSNGENETAISFLPLTHIFARALHYGFVAYGSSVFFTTPENLSRDLQKVRPTVFATVPRLLEKVYARIVERAATMSGVKKRLLVWALGLASRYEMGKTPTGLYAAQLSVANRLVFEKWREALGGRVKYIIAGGAALSGHLANLFFAAGVNILQGYGLTETSPVITYNRPNRNRAGTVGEPIPGVEVKIAADGEILTRGPHLMTGYYREEEMTRQVIDEEGWLHTGDVGEFTHEGFLRITDRKKDLFKLSTGKYVMPAPLESRLSAEPLVEQVVVIGQGEKFCAALIFPDHDVLLSTARSKGIGTTSMQALTEHPEVMAMYRELVDKANEGIDPWSTIKNFVLVSDKLTPENGLLTPTMKVRKSRVRDRYEGVIRGLYDKASPS
jgi:long-chain acyl-CoA synthetase